MADRPFVSATYRRVKGISIKSSTLIGWGVVVLIFAILWMAFVIHVNHEVDEIVTWKTPLSTRGEVSIDCWDGNACSVDIKTRISCPSQIPNTACDSYECSHIQLADGSECNQNDFCYADDPLKTCVDGTCRSPNASLCLGYCDDNIPCCDLLDPSCVFPYKLNLLNPGEVYHYCAYNSCVTLVISDVPIPDPANLFVNANIGDLNQSACIESVCTTDFFNDITACLYQWACAPYVSVTNKKRAISSSTTLKIDNETIKPLPVKSRDRDIYLAINELVLSKIMTHIEQKNNNAL